MIFSEEEDNDRAPLLVSNNELHQQQEGRQNDHYDLGLLEIPDNVSLKSPDALNREISKRKRMKSDEFVHFVTIEKWQNPSWPSRAEAASFASFDPFGVDSNCTSSGIQELPVETEDFFMPDPMVDPSGLTVDSFYLNSFAKTNGIEFYPNRAVKLYYQTSSLPPDGIPEVFLCPIGLEIMADPVILPDGHSYDRKTLMKWLKVNNSSPATRQVVSLEDIRPNWMLRNLILQFKQKKEIKERKVGQNYKIGRRQRHPVAFSDDGISRLAI